MKGGGEAPKPWASRVALWLVLASSTLNLFINRASSSSSSSFTAHPTAHEPQHRSPTDKSTHGGSDQPLQPIIPPDHTLQQVEFQADIEARNDLVLSSPASLNPFNQTSTAAPPEDGFDDQTFQPMKSSNIFQLHPNPQPHHQLHTSPYYNSIRKSFSLSLSSKEPSPFSSSLSSEEPSPTYSPTKHSPNSPDMKAEARITLITSKKKSGRWEPILYVMKIIDKQELGKHILGVAITMGMGLVLSIRSLATTFEMHVVAIALSCALAAIWNGILLRRTYPNASALILIAGVALIAFAFYAFLGCFLPLMLKWIPALCWLATLFPLAAFVMASLHRAGEEKDPENGQSY